MPVFVVELTALALVLTHIPGTHADRGDLAIMVTLCVLGVLHTEIAVGVERIRRRVTEAAPHVDLSSVWTFAGAVLLPPALASGVVVVVFTHLWWRAWRPRVPVYRQIFSTATVVLACHGASAVLVYLGVGKLGTGVGAGGAPMALVLGLLAYTTVNSGLIAGAIAVSTPHATASQVLGHWDENILEIATLCLGALAAAALAINPWLVVLVLPPLLVLHRAVLVRQLEQAASTDGKTGLLNAAAWHTQAEREVRRARRQNAGAAVLILDLDHFKAVNDRHGHLAGDQVLSSVAEALQAEVRDNDLVGRFGGEEFVVLLPGLDGGSYGREELEAVAERIRRRVARLAVHIPTPDGRLTVTGLSVSVGGARFPDDGADLKGLMEVADSALYAAKRAGRNLVRMGLHGPGPAPLSRAATEPPVQPS
ncbi:sensor domain-containing diguanylate cyclase [Pseudonocardia acidicola]|uniref:GGDEF domain-containing protein n=1 Tax=Pseudonocardia acidicola TaxID=2724939 RepID=A0ABX1S6C5_9PSEU|nr:GGDEF domain-containing protein [Pseudonocardia acidicola]NMH96467.1 GGDEF domain-containing protein [Pseudonocardia acidicola]